MLPQDIEPKLLADFCRRWDIREFAVFGSALRGDMRVDSDIDILVELQPDHPHSLWDWIDLRDELAAWFGREIDLVAKDGLKNPIRRREILGSAKVLYAA